MLKVYGVGRGKAKAARSDDAEKDKQPDAQKKRQPGEIRVQKEMDELELPPQTTIEWLDENNIMTFRVVIKPDEGFWRGAAYSFIFVIPNVYPHDPPKVKCETKIYHPNIDLQGNVCLNILREDWKPVLSISSVILGLLHLLLDPNPTDPLNHAAAEELRSSRVEFAKTVKKTLQGISCFGETFPKLI